MKSNKFAEKNKNKFKMINFSQKFRKYTNFFPNYDLAKLKQIRTMKVCNKIKIIIFDKINKKILLKRKLCIKRKTPVH